MNMEEDECICSLRCVEHEEEDVESDECVCTVTCNGVQTHILPIESNRDTEYNLGIKYCPGTEPGLPIYTHVEYKSTTSTGKFTIFKYSTSTTGGEDGRGEETVGGEEEEQPERRGEEL